MSRISPVSPSSALLQTVLRAQIHTMGHTKWNKATFLLSLDQLKWAQLISMIHTIREICVATDGQYSILKTQTDVEYTQMHVP